MTLAQYVRLPVIAWNADNSGFEQGGGGSLHLQLAPSLKHQARAIITLLDRYGWHTFSVITGTIAGHRNFDQVHTMYIHAIHTMGKNSPPFKVCKQMLLFHIILVFLCARVSSSFSAHLATSFPPPRMRSPMKYPLNMS